MTKKLLIPVLFGAMAITVAAPSNHDLHEAMEKFEKGGLMDPLKAALKEGNGGEAKKQIKEIQAVYTVANEFFKDKNAAVGTEQSDKGLKALAAMVKAIDASQMEKTEELMKEFQSTCRGCHTVHRERKPEGGYKTIGI
jgi:hypothetical protein